MQRCTTVYGASKADFALGLSSKKQKSNIGLKY